MIYQFNVPRHNFRKIKKVFLSKEEATYFLKRKRQVFFYDLNTEYVTEIFDAHEGMGKDGYYFIKLTEDEAKGKRFHTLMYDVFTFFATISLYLTGEGFYELSTTTTTYSLMEIIRFFGLLSMTWITINHLSSLRNRTNKIDSIIIKRIKDVY